MKCGDVLLVTYPFTDQSGSKVRPVLLVSVDSFNAGEDIVVVPISASASPDDSHVYSIAATDTSFSQTGLKKSSTVKWTKPMSISRRVVERRLGSLPDHKLREIQGLVREIFGG